MCKVRILGHDNCVVLGLGAGEDMSKEYLQVDRKVRFAET